jgi:hypothetical protein
MMLRLVALVMEMAREAPARGSLPRWPTNMRDMMLTVFCSKQLATIGPARRSSRFHLRRGGALPTLIVRRRRREEIVDRLVGHR